MFQHVGRRLAILNAVVVIAIVATVGAVTFLTLRRSLDREIDNALRERIEQVQDTDSVLPASTAEPQDDGHDEHDDDEHDEHRDEDEAILASGDTIVVIIDRAGRIINNPRNIELEGIPVTAGVEHALGGDTDIRSVSLDNNEAMRVMTSPLVDDGEIVGAIQVLRSLREHDAELAIVQWMTLLGMALGVIIAIPAGLYLSSRAMRPINSAFERQRAFVADASHELRTPLTLMRANADYALMDETKRVADVRTELQNIVAEVDRTDRLVDDLLILARADARQLQLDLGEVDLTMLIAEAAEALRPVFSAHDVALDTPSSSACFVRADGAYVVQVLRIVLENAARHTPAGGAVVVEVRRLERFVEVEIRDTGEGIPPEHLPHVFERFYRADKARSRAAGGVGLGLAIARALVTAQGGSIWVQSHLGRGTSVFFTLPSAHFTPA